MSKTIVSVILAKSNGGYHIGTAPIVIIPNKILRLRAVVKNDGGLLNAITFNVKRQGDSTVYGTLTLNFDAGAVYAGADVRNLDLPAELPSLKIIDGEITLPANLESFDYRLEFAATQPFTIYDLEFSQDETLSVSDQNGLNICQLHIVRWSNILKARGRFPTDKVKAVRDGNYSDIELAQITMALLKKTLLDYNMSVPVYDYAKL